MFNAFQQIQCNRPVYTGWLHLIDWGTGSCHQFWGEHDAHLDMICRVNLWHSEITHCHHLPVWIFNSWLLLAVTNEMKPLYNMNIQQLTVTSSDKWNETSLCNMNIQQLTVTSSHEWNVYVTTWKWFAPCSNNNHNNNNKIWQFMRCHNIKTMMPIISVWYQRHFDIKAHVIIRTSQYIIRVCHFIGIYAHTHTNSHRVNSHYVPLMLIHRTTFIVL